jgi:hypothetical protein
MDQSYCEVKNRQILPPDCMRCRVPGAAIVHKTLNEQRNLARASWPDDCTEPAGTSGGATVVQVASDPIIHAQSPSPLRHPRSAQADHAPSPFESLLDDSAPAADRPAPPPTVDKTSRADGSQPVRTSGNSHDSKAPPAHDDDIATKPRMMRTSMRFNRRRVRSNVKSARIPRSVTAPRTATMPNPRKTTNPQRARKLTTLYQRHRSRASGQTSRSMRLRQYRRQGPNPTSVRSHNCRNRPRQPRNSQLN